MRIREPIFWAHDCFNHQLNLQLRSGHRPEGGERVFQLEPVRRHAVLSARTRALVALDRRRLEELRRQAFASWDRSACTFDVVVCQFESAVANLREGVLRPLRNGRCARLESTSTASRTSWSAPIRRCLLMLNGFQLSACSRSASYASRRAPLAIQFPRAELPDAGLEELDADQPNSCRFDKCDATVSRPVRP